MGFRIVKSDSSLLVSLDRAAVIRARLAADPRTAILAIAWDDWIGDWKKRYLEEIDHRIAVLTANAVATVLDEDLDGLAGETWNATEAYPVERAFFFGNKTRAEFVKPKLGSQYVAMGAWISHMASSQIVPLVEIGKRLGPKHKEATLAIETAQNADAAQREFRVTGARRQLVDRFNALGKKTEGELKELPHAHPELGLPNDFFERFLSNARSVVEPTLKELIQRRDEIKANLAQAEAEVEAALKAEQDEKNLAAEAQRKVDEEALAQARAERAESDKKIEELEARLKKPEPTPPNT